MFSVIDVTENKGLTARHAPDEEPSVPDLGMTCRGTIGTRPKPQVVPSVPWHGSGMELCADHLPFP